MSCGATGDRRTSGMNGPTLRVVAIFLALAGTVPASVARAQGAYEIQVYPSEVVTKGVTMVEFHTNYTPSGLRVPDQGIQPDEHALHETLEVTHGFNEWFEVGGYLFTSYRAGDGWQWVGSHVRPRVSVPARWHWPVGLSLSQEIGYQRVYFSPDAWTWEIRPIVDQQLGRFYWSVNIALEKTLSGEHVHDGWGLSPAAKISVQLSGRLQAGVEYYGDLGTINRFDPWRSQGQQLFPAVDVDFGPKWEFNAGVGFGLTPASDQFQVKAILGYRFGVRPEP